MKYRNRKTGEIIENIIKARDRYITHLYACSTYRKLAEAMGYEPVPEPGDDAVPTDDAARTFAELSAAVASSAEPEPEPVEALPKWVRPGAAIPPEGELVLVIVSGQPCRHIRLVYAVELATWTRKDGWVLDEFPDYECPKIHFWAPIPELPEEARV